MNFAVCGENCCAKTSLRGDTKSKKWSETGLIQRAQNEWRSVQKDTVCVCAWETIRLEAWSVFSTLHSKLKSLSSIQNFQISLIWLWNEKIYLQRAFQHPNILVFPSVRWNSNCFFHYMHTSMCTNGPTVWHFWFVFKSRWLWLVVINFIVDCLRMDICLKWVFRGHNFGLQLNILNLDWCI